MPNISYKYVEDTEKVYQNAMEQFTKAKERLATAKSDMETAQKVARSIPKCMEIKTIGKHFKHMVVVPSQFGIIVELGFVKDSQVAGMKRFLTEAGFTLMKYEDSVKAEICWYQSPEGHTYLIRFGKTS